MSYNSQERNAIANAWQGYVNRSYKDCIEKDTVVIEYPDYPIVVPWGIATLKERDNAAEQYVADGDYVFVAELAEHGRDGANTPALFRYYKDSLPTWEPILPAALSSVGPGVYPTYTKIRFVSETTITHYGVPYFNAKNLEDDEGTPFSFLGFWQKVDQHSEATLAALKDWLDNDLKGELISKFIDIEIAKEYNVETLRSIMDSCCVEAMLHKNAQDQAQEIRGTGQLFMDELMELVARLRKVYTEAEDKDAALEAFSIPSEFWPSVAMIPFLKGVDAVVPILAPDAVRWQLSPQEQRSFYRYIGDEYDMQKLRLIRVDPHVIAASATQQRLTFKNEQGDTIISFG